MSSYFYYFLFKKWDHFGINCRNYNKNSDISHENNDFNYFLWEKGIILRL